MCLIAVLKIYRLAEVLININIATSREENLPLSVSVILTFSVSLLFTQYDGL